MEPANNSPRIFRKPIPDLLFWNIFSIVGIKGPTNTSFFKKSSITPQKCEVFSSYKIKLKDYYHIHKYFLLNREIDPTRMVQILRQMARSRGYIFEGKEYVEKISGSPKRMMYRLICSQEEESPITQFEEQSFEVRFE